MDLTAVRGWFEAAAHCLAISNPAEKCRAVNAACDALRSGTLIRDETTPLRPIGPPGRPPRPRLVGPGQVPRRRLGSPGGRAALVHAIAHIEFNAVNLALDAVYRFRDLPDTYYRDWFSVAEDEVRHFRMLSDRMRALGHAYGDFPAHNGLWEMAEKTAGSCLERMALVPRVLEARGLDVTPGMVRRLEAVGDRETVATLEVILAEEVRHVEIGSRWFRYCCRRQEKDPEETFQALLKRHFTGAMRGPFNREARLEAGFSERELTLLERLD